MGFNPLGMLQNQVRVPKLESFGSECQHWIKAKTSACVMYPSSPTKSTGPHQPLVPRKTKQKIIKEILTTPAIFPSKKPNSIPCIIHYNPHPKPTQGQQKPTMKFKPITN